VALVFALCTVVRGQDGVLDLRASVVGQASPAPATLQVKVLRWSTDAERAPIIAAFAAPPPPATPPPSATAQEPQGGAAGRGGRGGRGAPAGGRGGPGGRGAAPLTPEARVNAAVRTAPTLGFIWGGGPTGYSIKYAWQSAAAGASRQIVLVTDRRIGAYQPFWPSATAPAGEAEFTVIELHVDSSGNGEAKTSLVSSVVADAGAGTLALAAYAAAPVQLRIAK
jgi:hypothetical protein